ncbi:MAG: pyridoxal-phosphate dependent enzyme [Pseudomonadota bacterium]
MTKKLTGFYADLEKLLKQQLSTDPAAPDLHLKLLDLYFETASREEFIIEAQRFARGIKDKANSREWQKVISMGRTLAPNNGLFLENAGDKIEFVEASANAPATKTYKRFGDDSRSQRHFKELATHWEKLRTDPAFITELDRELLHYAGRPSSLFHARHLSQLGDGAQIYFKREDLSPAGTHLQLSVLGQTLFAKRLNKKTVVTATRNGQRGVVVASAAARLGLHSIIYMDGEDMHRQSGNVFRMWLMGADVRSADIKHLGVDDVRNAALEHWLNELENCFLVMGLDSAPEPYPSMAVQFSSAIGRECARQVRMLAQRAPDVLVARGGDNSDAIGLFPAFLNEKSPRLVCVEAADIVAPVDGNAAANFDPLKSPMNDVEKRVAGAILEGLEYPSVIREHAMLRNSGRVEYVKIGADLVKQAIRDLSQKEGLIPGIQTAHAVAWAVQEARRMKQEQIIVVLIAETVDKDIWDIGRAMGVPF